ncbi:uncharacterized protein LOC120193777 [Hibiscus syriacus]|uniref:uncharacterized protein LOC120193777 n=1 Tax=Hibiscus syriacus TaxID=106335 RepID=UPI0019219687|nr:uncharacterized protein LOC120193777 [Hibiscus syriacus]
MILGAATPEVVVHTVEALVAATVMVAEAGASLRGQDTRAGLHLYLGLFHRVPVQCHQPAPFQDLALGLGHQSHRLTVKMREEPHQTGALGAGAGAGVAVYLVLVHHL